MQNNPAQSAGCTGFFVDSSGHDFEKARAHVNSKKSLCEASSVVDGEL
jgi:hypothetical protein